MSVSVKGGGGGGISSSDVTASKAQVLSGYTALTSDSNDEAVNGTMTNRGAVTATVGVGGSYTIPEGFHNGEGVVSGATLSGDAAVANVLSGKTFYSNSGTKQTGTMTNRGAVSQTLGINGSYTIPAGFHNGSGKVTQSITTKAAATYTPTTSNQTISAGQYLSGVQTIKGDSNLVAANIMSGKSIFGVSGSMQKYAVTSPNSGISSTASFTLQLYDGSKYTTSTVTRYYISKTSLGFTPIFASVYYTLTDSSSSKIKNVGIYNGTEITFSVNGSNKIERFINVPFTKDDVKIPTSTTSFTCSGAGGYISGYY